MTRLLTIALLLLLAALLPAQTYTVPVGTSCTTSVNGCTLHDLTTTALTPTPWGYFVGGTYWTQFDFQEYQGQNAAAGATYCVGTGSYTQTPRPDLGPTAAEWTLDCYSDQWTNASGPGEVSSGPYHIVVDLITHSYQQVVHMNRVTRVITVVAVDAGTVTLTAVPQ